MALFTSLATAAAVIGAGAAVVGAYGSYKSQANVASAQRKSEALARRRSSFQAIRKAQLIRATSIASAVGSGSDGGSGYFGGIGAVGSQLGGALGYASQQSGLSGVIAKQSQRAAAWSGVAEIGTIAAKYGASRGGFDFLNPEEELPDLTRPVN